MYAFFCCIQLGLVLKDKSDEIIILQTLSELITLLFSSKLKTSIVPILQHKISLFFESYSVLFTNFSLSVITFFIFPMLLITEVRQTINRPLDLKVYIDFLKSFPKHGGSFKNILSFFSRKGEY